MKHRAITTLLGLVALLIVVRAAYVYADATYVNTFGMECIAVREGMETVVGNFLASHPGCKIVSRGALEDAGYIHIECGDSHIVTGSHVAFNGKSACERFANLDAEGKFRTVGDHLGHK